MYDDAPSKYARGKEQPGERKHLELLLVFHVGMVVSR
jgi:hypothetical protein